MWTRRKWVRVPSVTPMRASSNGPRRQPDMLETSVRFAPRVPTDREPTGEGSTLITCDGWFNSTAVYDAAAQWLSACLTCRRTRVRFTPASPWGRSDNGNTAALQAEDRGSIPRVSTMPAKPMWIGAALVTRRSEFDSRRGLRRSRSTVAVLGFGIAVTAVRSRARALRRCAQGEHRGLYPRQPCSIHGAGSACGHRSAVGRLASNQ